MKRFFGRSVLVPVALVAGIMLVSQATAQSASEVTPQTFQPPLRNLGGALVFDGRPGTQAPPGAETIGITLSGVTIRGAIPTLSTANQAFEARLTGGRVPVSELFDATAALEEAYANAGLVLTRVVLPQQTLRDGGNLRVDVVNGFVETVDDATVPENARSRLGSLVNPLVNRPGITLNELERQLLLAGDVSGIALSTALATGERQGGTILALDAKYKPVTSFIGIDNYANPDLGQPTFNAGVEVNSILNMGESFYGRFSGATDDIFGEDPRYRVGAIGALVPIGSNGLTLNLEVTRSVTNPDNDVAQTSSTFDRESLRLFYPFIRSRNVNFSGQFVFDHQRDTQDLISGGTTTAIYKDDISVIRIGANGSYRGSDVAVSEGGITLSKGIDALTADVSDAPQSRDGANTEFTKIAVSFRHERSLGERLSVSVNGRAQSALGDTLVASEQFGVVGAGDLSTFDAGAIRGDSGAVFRTELAYLTRMEFAGGNLAIAPYAFAGAGTARLSNPTALEDDSVDASAYGVGVDFLLQGESPFRADSIRIEFGRGSRSDGPDDNRFSISGNLRF